jgi:hypothetical protein
MEVVMKKVLLRCALVIAVALGASVAIFADTIHLKDGSVIRGQIIGFKNEQFTIVVGRHIRSVTKPAVISTADQRAASLEYRADLHAAIQHLDE